VVLHGLKAADDLVELLALRHVVHREVQHALGQAQHLGSSGECTALAGCVPDLLALSAVEQTGGIGCRPAYP
jgi:hypothetical protein